jgi:tetratricopeptide (TPR) repeat protein
VTTLIASTAERNRQKRQLAEQAIKLAMQNNWQEAVEVNRQMIELAPDEPDAWNRLGKALSELERYREAQEAYQEALNRDANNSIARKQVKRLELLLEAEPATEVRATKLDPKLLIEETGKTGIFELEKPASASVLARMAAGNQVYLKPQGSEIVVEDHRGNRLGEVPVKTAARLIDLMKNGNEYAAGVTSSSEHRIRILIREMKQSAANDGRVSFPSKGGPLPPELRAYTKDRALRFDYGEEEDLYDEVEEEETEESDAETEETTSDIEYYEEGETSSGE